jgi:hypothetical protein
MRLIKAVVSSQMSVEFNADDPSVDPLKCGYSRPLHLKRGGTAPEAARP